MKIWCRLVVVLFAGCGVDDKAEVDEDFTDLATVDVKSDAFSYRLKLLGSLVDGEARGLLYTSTPRFRGFELRGNEGDQVDLWVRGPRGDALTWLLDGRFQVIAKNDDADDSTLDSHLVATLPASTDNRYYVVLRDYHLESRRFRVQLDITSNETAIHPLATNWLGYAAANGGMFGWPMAPDDLSGPAQAKLADYATRFPATSITAHGFATEHGETAIAIVGCQDAVGWVDLYEPDGDFAVHGATQHGCATPSWIWQPAEWDPSL